MRACVCKLCITNIDHFIINILFKEYYIFINLNFQYVFSDLCHRLYTQTSKRPIMAIIC